MTRIFSILLTGLSVVSAYALDADRNGMSDVWEGLYPAVSSSSADPDEDGASNLDESFAWTDPGDSNSIFQIEAFALTSFEWIGVPWMRYQVRSGTDLLEWRREGGERTGMGGTEAFTGGTDAARLFYKVQALSALNSDTDALTNLEEDRLGTNPQYWDSDDDKVADDQEIIQGTDPLASMDTDSDTLPDDWERWIIHANDSDGILTLEDVVPGGDFDSDGVANSNEFLLGTSPVAPRRNIVFFLSED